MSPLHRLMGVFIFRGIGSGLSILFTLLAANLMEQSEASKIFLLTSIITILSICLRWGLDEVIIRRVATTAPSLQAAIGYSLLQLSHARVAKIFLLCLLLIPLFKSVDTAYEIYLLKISDWLLVLVTAAIISLLACHARVLQGSGKTNMSIFMLNILVPGAACVLLIAGNLLGLPLSADAVALQYALVPIVAYGLTMAWIIKNQGKAILHAQQLTVAQKRTELTAANQLGVVVLAQQLMSWGAILIVPALFSSEIYSSFVISQKLSMLIGFVMLTVNFTLSSRMAKLHEKKNPHELRKVVGDGLLLILISALTIGTAVILLRNDIINYTNSTYDQSATLIVIFVAAQIFNAISAYFSLALSMLHHEAFLMRAQSLMNVTGLIAFTGFSVTFDVIAASTTFVITYAMLAILLGQRLRLALTKRPHSQE